MKKLWLLALVLLLAVVLSYLSYLGYLSKIQPESPKAKRPILRLAIVSDSHGEDELLAKALKQAQGEGINFVIGLGDWSRVGTAEELTSAKKVFDEAKIPYIVTAGDHDLWDSRNRGEEPLSNFREVFGQSTQQIERDGIQIVILDNSDIYRGIAPESWELLEKVSKVSNVSNVSQEEKKSETFDTSGTCDTCGTSKLTFVFAHKTPFHPESKHVMGEDSLEVARQAERFLELLRSAKVDGFFSGDLHFFAQFKDPSGLVKMTTVGAVTKERNFQGPRFAIVTVFDDYSWNVEDVEIR